MTSLPPSTHRFSSIGHGKNALEQSAGALRDEVFGREIFVRGVIEVSNFCRQNCHYCGMRRDNRDLKRFRVDTLKIDQSFVRDILTDADDASIALAVISLAHSLRMRVLAEGVETVEQYEFLRLNGCDEIQGYYFSKPVPPGELAVMLKAHKRLAAA